MCRSQEKPQNPHPPRKVPGLNCLSANACGRRLSLHFIALQGCTSFHHLTFHSVHCQSPASATHARVFPSFHCAQANPLFHSAPYVFRLIPVQWFRWYPFTLGVIFSIRLYKVSIFYEDSLHFYGKLSIKKETAYVKNIDISLCQQTLKSLTRWPSITGMSGRLSAGICMQITCK